MISDTGSRQEREVLGGFFSLIVSWKVPQARALSAMPVPQAMPVSPDASSSLPSCREPHCRPPAVRSMAPT